ncbi:MAG TPA: hypothetical protein VEN79_13705, partial [Terriglobia bacterium]|nr:hypothetical protein [Terriglobia bacterium]
MKRWPGLFAAAAISFATLIFLAAPGARSFSSLRSANRAAGAGATQSADHGSPEFLRTADEVLAQMSQLLSLPVKAPLKKSLRSKKEIREYLIREDQED